MNTWPVKCSPWNAPTAKRLQYIKNVWMALTFCHILLTKLLLLVTSKVYSYMHFCLDCHPCFSLSLHSPHSDSPITFSLAFLALIFYVLLLSSSFHTHYPLFLLAWSLHVNVTFLLLHVLIPYPLPPSASSLLSFSLLLWNKTLLTLKKIWFCYNTHFP